MAALRMVEDDHHRLKKHLFPADGFEAAAILICGLAGRMGDQLLLKEMLLIPYEECETRTQARLVWPGVYLEKAVERADVSGESIILMHSHPGGFYEFSDIDDTSDQSAINVLLHGVSSASSLHGSAIMVPDGRVRARLYDRNMTIQPISKVSCVGHDICDLTREKSDSPLPYSSGMTNDLAGKTAVVVGVSGTGSIVAESLARLGVGHIILVDYDRVESKNLNRILYATPSDIGRYKTDVLRDAICAHHPKARVETFETPIDDSAVQVAASEADIIFSCVDSMEGRLYCDLMVEAFLCPLIDVGVMIPTRRLATEVAVADVCGRIDYIRPAGVSMWGRGIITAEGLSAEYLRRTDPESHQKQIEEGYLRGVPEEAPSVISLNMRAASAAVNEWLLRLYAIRHSPNHMFTKTYFSLAAGEEEYFTEAELGVAERSKLFAQGSHLPLLGNSGASTDEKAAA